MSTARTERGWALVSVLWVVAMLALLAGATEELTLVSHRTEHRAWERAQADAALDAGVVQAVAGIAASTASERWRVDGASREIIVSGLPVRVAVQAEAGRYDLNAIDVSVLVDLFRSADVDQDRAMALADNVVGWRSIGPFHSLHGATDEDYAISGRPYRPRHARFQRVDELQLVLGITPDLYRQIRPALTVYTRRSMIDPALAPREALMVLYRGDADRVSALLRSRETASSDDTSGSSPGIVNLGLPLAGATFTVDAQTQIGGRIYRRATVLLLTGVQSRPYLVLARSS